jgi:hypothetical protein
LTWALWELTCLQSWQVSATPRVIEEQVHHSYHQLGGSLARLSCDRIGTQAMPDWTQHAQHLPVSSVLIVGQPRLDAPPHIQRGLSQTRPLLTPT